MLVAGSSKSLEAAQKDADKYGSVLRYGKSMTLTSVKKPSLKLSYYQLPKGTKKQKLNIPGNIPKTDTDSGNEKKAVGKGGFLGDLLKGSSGADKDETKSNSSDEVKKGVNKILNSFFK
ncbi:MAG: hypothetical protein HN931_13530, partial [Desulfobacterales bacterium]|nr:hypothetical protein [Desulfobacterales bacterium]